MKSFPYLKSAELKSAPSLVLSFHPSSHRRTARVPYGVANGRALSAFGIAFKQLIVKSVCVAFTFFLECACVGTCQCKKKIRAICPYTEQRGSHSLGNYYLHQNLPSENTSITLNQSKDIAHDKDVRIILLFIHSCHSPRSTCHVRRR